MSKHTKGPWTATQSDPAEGCDLWWITACPAANQEKRLRQLLAVIRTNDTKLTPA